MGKERETVIKVLQYKGYKGNCRRSERVLAKPTVELLPSEVLSKWQELGETPISYAKWEAFCIAKCKSGCLCLSYMCIHFPVQTIPTVTLFVFHSFPLKS